MKGKGIIASIYDTYYVQNALLNDLHNLSYLILITTLGEGSEVK